MPIRGGGGIRQFLGSALWLYPRKGAPVSRHALAAAVDRLERLGRLVDLETYQALLNRCGDVGAADLGRRVQLSLVRAGCRTPPTTLCNALLRMHAKLGQLDEARAVFRSLLRRGIADAWTWHYIVQALLEQPDAQMGHLGRRRYLREALTLLRGALQAGHGSGSERTLVWTLAASGHLREARRLLEEEAIDDVIAWNGLVFASVKHRQWKRAIKTARRMPCPVQPTTLLSLATACTMSGDLAAARAVELGLAGDHDRLTTVATCAIVAMYAGFGLLEEARRAFDGRRATGVHASWAAMLLAYARCPGYAGAAVELHRLMDQHGVTSEGAVYSTLIGACVREDVDQRLQQQGRAIQARAAAEGYSSTTGR